MATRMIQRRGTAAEWTSANPVLAAGEIGFETDTTKFKFGDGTTAWADIPYFASADQLIDGAPELLDTLNELAAAIGDDEDFIGTITSDLDGKLNLTGGTITGNLIVSGADASFGGSVTLGEDPTNPTQAATKSYVDAADSAIQINVNTIQYDLETLQSTVTDNSQSITGLTTDAGLFRPIFMTATQPTASDNNDEDFVDGSLWYDRSTGQLFVLSVLDSATATTVWVETGGTNDLVSAVYGNNNNDFPFDPAPSNGDTHQGYIYNSDRNAWQVDRSLELEFLSDVHLENLANGQVMMYNSTSSRFENIAGVILDVDGEIPTSYLTKGTDLAVSQVVDGASESYNTLADIETYLTSTIFTDVPQLTIKSDTDWGTDVSVPLSGSLNVETGGNELRVKVGNGTDTYANLDYIPSNAGITSEIAAAIAHLAPKADPTFSGTVSLPSTTSIGDVSDAEIAHLDGVTSGIQGQLDSLDTLKAPLADPAFTGTVSGIDKTMVGLNNVDNIADADKPVSTAQQAALDTKLNLAGGTMAGSLILNADPTQALGAVTKQYVDSVEAGLISRPAVKAATIANLSGTYTNGTAGVDAQINLGQLATLDIDDITNWDQYDGILVKDQTNKSENGRYVVLQIGNATDTDWILKRCPLCDEADEIPGSYIFVTDGTTNEQTGWVQHVDDPATFTVGTDDIDVYQFAGAGAVTAGTNVSVAGNQVSVVDAPTFAGTVDASAAGVAFSDGTQTQAGVPSLTTFVEKTASYQLDTLDHKDNVVEMNMSTAGTFTVPLDATLSWPVGASMDIFATGTGEITIAGEAGVTLNATPGLTLRTQWSSATIMKRGANNWVVYGDLKA